jgi:CheY-like chemotaxis protein
VVSVNLDNEIGAKKKLIYVIEDDRDIRESMIEFLESEGYQVGGASNGQEALDYLRKTSDLPNLILLDLMMPIKDGIAFRDEQRDDAVLGKVPVVIMSADAHLQDKKVRAGVNEFLKKPVDLDDLLKVVDQYLN